MTTNTSSSPQTQNNPTPGLPPPPIEIYSSIILDPKQLKLVETLQNEVKRLDQEIALQEQQSKTLKKDIEVTASERIRLLPLEIQKEHDAVSMEIADLNWHLSRAKRKMKQVDTKKERCEILHKQLKESIANVDRHAPMVEDKLVLEQTEMKDISEKQVEADAAYKKVKADFDEVEALYLKKMNQLDLKKASHQKELDFHKEDLAKLVTILGQKETEYQQYKNDIESLETQAANYENEAKETRREIDKSIKEEECLYNDIDGLKTVIRKLDEDYNNLMTEKEELNTKIEEEHAEKKLKLENLKVATEVATKQLLSHQDEIKALQMDIEDDKEESIVCQQHIDQSTRETDRLIAEKNRTEKELSKCVKDKQSLDSKLGLVSIQLETESKRVFGEETRLKSRLDGLRKQQQNNFQIKLLLEDKIERSKNELEKLLKDNVRKQTTAREKVKKAENTAEESKNKLEKCQIKLKDVEEQRVSIKLELEEYIRSTEESVGKLVHEEHDLEIRFNKINTEVIQLKANIEKIKNHSVKLTNEKKDMQIQCKAMKTKIVNGEENLKILHVLMKKKREEVAREEALNEELHRQLDATENRLKKRKEQNEKLLESRQIYFREIMKNLKHELDRNEQLSVVYKQIQTYNLAAKQAVLKVNEQRSYIEISVKEQEQLLKLQSKTQTQLENLLDKQKQANQARIDYLNYTEQLNSNALGVIKNDLIKSVKDVDAFIDTNNVNVPDVDFSREGGRGESSKKNVGATAITSRRTRMSHSRFGGGPSTKGGAYPKGAQFLNPIDEVASSATVSALDKPILKSLSHKI